METEQTRPEHPVRPVAIGLIVWAALTAFVFNGLAHHNLVALVLTALVVGLLLVLAVGMWQAAHKVTR